MADKAQILVIEDDPDGLRSVREAIEDAGHDAVAASTGRAGLDRFHAGGIDVVITDLVLPDIDGIEVLTAIRQADAQVPVLLMTAYGSVETAVRALKSGAYDYLIKPLDLDDIQSRLTRAVETRRLRAEVKILHHEMEERYSARTMVAESPVMQEVLRRIQTVASTHATVLILGESGTGKELVARALHVDGQRSGGPFVAINCGAFAETLLESELFGHEKGAFTGAVHRHAGAFERAHGGTLFLDEIGLAPKSVQARLLRAIEEREVLRVGGREPVKVDVRIVAASNRNLKELAETGVFMADLLYRLQVVTIAMPPLRARRGDIRPLVDRFVAVASMEHNRRIDSVESDYYEALERYVWPGNIRELRNVVESSVIMATTTVLTSRDLALDVAGEPGQRTLRLPSKMTLASIEREAFLQALSRHGGNRLLAAEELGVSSRTVIRKIKEYDLPF